MAGRAWRRLIAGATAGFAVVALATAPGFTASLDLTPSPAGEGSGAVSGFQVSEIDHVLGDDPSMLEAVQFALDGPASGAQVQVRLVSDSDVWYPCAAEGPMIRCETSTPRVALAEVDELRVVAAD